MSIDPKNNGMNQSKSSDIVPAPPTALEAFTEKTLLDYVPLAMIPYIKQVPQEYFMMTEAELERVAYPGQRKTRSLGNRAVPGQTMFDVDTKLRLSFWNEYERASTVNRRMNAAFIYAQTVHSENFFKRVCADPKRLAWIICPPGDYMAKMTQVLNCGIERLEEILKMPLYRQICRCHYQCVCKHPTGYSKAYALKKKLQIVCCCGGPKGCICPPLSDPRVADVILKCIEKIEMRTKGAIVMKVDERRLNVNLFGKAPTPPTQQIPPPGEQVPQDMGQIDDELKKLESEAVAVATQPEEPAVDAEFRVEDSKKEESPLKE